MRGWWVASTATRQFLTGSTRPSEKKQCQLLPSTEFPDPSSLLVPCSAAPPGASWEGECTAEPQMWARRVNLKFESMSRDDHFQQVISRQYCAALHMFPCVSPWLGIFRHAVTVARVICRRFGRVKTRHTHTHTHTPTGLPTGGLESK